jgi:glyoxylase-like metal-dependent hydrolase (beta-lactamase superfamily II)
MAFKEETPYFILHEVSDGVYAAAAKPGQGAWSNAGFVDLGNEVLVFDTFNTPSAAAELKRQAEKHTRKRVAYAVNSHFHGDHVFGNQLFADAVIISTRTTRQWFEEKNVLGDLADEQKETAAYLAGLQKKISATAPGVVRDSLINQHGEVEKLLADLPMLKMVEPSLTFDNQLTIHGSKRSVELQCYGAGHTASDTIMYVSDAEVLFAGDLVTENLHVPIYDPLAFRQAINRLTELEVAALIPGHGSIGTKRLLEPLAAYLDLLIASSKEAATSGVSLENFIADFTVPDEFKTWRGITGMERNLKTGYQFFAAQLESKE